MKHHLKNRHIPLVDICFAQSIEFFFAADVSVKGMLLE
jgi:hypothetical protein